MFDIRAIRNNPDEFDAGWARRELDEQTPAILSLDTQRRTVQVALQDAQADRNAESQKIGAIKKSGGDASEQMKFVAKLKEEISEHEEKERVLGAQLNDLLSSLPNLMSEEVPNGASEDDNQELYRWGEIKRESGADHVEIGEALGLIDFEVAAKMSGARFTMLKGALARMERALAQFFLDTHISDHGYMEISPPLLVRDNALYGTGQLPKFAEDQFSTKETNHFLIPTAEVPLTNIVANDIVEGESLPLRFCAHTPCFRSEAGSAGRDTRGMLRQHQFYKVEMVSITTPEQSHAEHERMLACAENVLKKLELPFRTVTLCSGDTGFGATKTYDIEVWLPGQETYREISSVSNCGDFQARRMNARSRNKGEKDTRFVHTLNGSGVAVGRALIAVIENYYDPEDGGIFVPEVLKPYMGSIEKITAK